MLIRSLISLAFVFSVNTLAQDKVLWDHWYTATVGGSSPYAYYNEKASITKGKMHIQTDLKRLEAGMVNEESLGAFAKADDGLTPLFFNLRQNQGGIETIIDGTVQESGQLVVNVRKASGNLPPVKKQITQGIFFSAMFPIWVHLNHKKLKLNQERQYQTIREDTVEGGFEQGKIRLEKPDPFANQSKTTKYVVHYLNVAWNWYLDQNGVAVRIEVPAMNLVIDRSTREKAAKFFGG